MDFLSLRDVRVTDPYFVQVMCVIKEKMIPYQWEIINDRVPGAEKSYCIANFKIAAGDMEGRYGGAVFQDTDVAKWLEAVAYSLVLFPDPELEVLADSTIALIGRAQQPDGYLNTYYTIEEPENRWQNLMEGHELYTAGHMIEAAVAYYDATGKRAFLDIVCRFADHILSIFGTQPGQCAGYPGHPEIELALYRLADATNDARYADLAQYFLDARGVGDNWFEMEKRRPEHRYIFPEMATFGPDYFQSDLPVRQLRVATGHAVRAVYLYTAMADAALRTGDMAMAEACGALYDNITKKQMYVTGAIGSAAHGERFTSDYDLPNDTMYAETCASIGLMSFSARMFRLTGSGGCYDIWERALRNTVLGAMNHDGTRFFYVNPLETDPAAIAKDPGRRHVKPERQKWFGVACCPPNIARTVLSIGKWLYAHEGDDLYLLAHMPSEANWNGRKLSLAQDGDTFTLAVSGDACNIYLRIPEGYTLSLAEDKPGFSRINHAGGTQAYTYALTAAPRLLRAHPRVAADAGKCAIDEGGLVYCLESADNGAHLQEVFIPEDAAFERIALPFLPEGMHALRLDGYRLSENDWTDALYGTKAPAYVPCELIAIPYSQWNNRGIGEMRVWLPLKPSTAP